MTTRSEVRPPHHAQVARGPAHPENPSFAQLERVALAAAARENVKIINLYAFYAYAGAMRYTFDPSKNAANLRKHGISLVEADGVLNDPTALTIEGDFAIGEERWVTIGMTFANALRVVFWAHRGDEIRIISVRRPEPSERHSYEEGL